MRPHLQPCAYKDNKGSYIAIREWAKQGKLNKVQENLLLEPTRSVEELYDLKKDPWELSNLADNPRYQKTLVEMRQSLDKWIKQNGDQGQTVESQEMYDSDMDAYLQGMAKSGRMERFNEIKNNISVMKKWWKEGK
jgi:arylsulfatase A-like enzyme